MCQAKRHAVFPRRFLHGQRQKDRGLSQAPTCKKIHFVEGNHDTVTRKLQDVFASWSSLSEIHVGKQGIVLCHYAMRVWSHSGRGAWQLYGHSHSNLPDEPLSLSMDVGVDTHDFLPWHFEEVKKIMEAKAIAKEQSLTVKEILRFIVT